MSNFPMSDFPIIVHIKTVLVFSALVLIAFHLIFLRMWRPGVLAWKFIDYVWIVADARTGRETAHGLRARLQPPASKAL
jgi:hypothetical protein